MFDAIIDIFSKFSIHHLNILLLLGLALFGGIIGGRLFQKFRVPQVVGYIVIGILIGESGFNLVDENVITALRPFNYFALGLIGYLVGGELRKEIFAKYGKHFLYILLCEGISPFILVTIATGILGTFVFGAQPFVWALSILLGAISSATDPATTTLVLKEYKTRGSLTTTILGIVALDDGLALILFSLASSIAGTIVQVQHAETGFWGQIIEPIYEIGGAVMIGCVSGYILHKILKRYSEKERILAFSIGMVLLVTGISLASHVSLLLAAMTLGIVTINSSPRKSRESFNLVEGFSPPIYVLFFVLVGAKLRFNLMTVGIFIMVVGYLIFGLSGKMLGAYIGAAVSKAPEKVRKYLPFSLFSQAGVAIGLSLLASQHFPGDIGNNLVLIITATTFATQLIGPSFTKFAVMKAQENGLDISEEELINQCVAKDLMNPKPPVIVESMTLKEIFKIFSKNDSLYYPVTNNKQKLTGIITVDHIKQIFLERSLEGFVLAYDLMEKPIAVTTPETPLPKVQEKLNQLDLEYMPVVNDTDTLEGFIERKQLNKLISTRMMALQKEANV